MRGTTNEPTMTVLTLDLLDTVVYSDDLDDLLYSQWTDQSTLREIDTIDVPEFRHKIDWMFTDEYVNG